MVTVTSDRIFTAVGEGLGGGFVHTVTNISLGNVQIDAVAAAVPFFERGDMRDALATTAIAGDFCSRTTLAAGAMCTFSLTFTTVDNDVANSGTNSGLWRTGATVFDRKPGDPAVELDSGPNLFIEVLDPGAVVTVPESATWLFVVGGLALVSRLRWKAWQA